MLSSQFNSANSVYVDLLDLKTLDLLLYDPSRFEDMINSKKTVIVDEIQRIPRLLDVVHSQIQKTKRQFIFTGSSARRLKQHGSNLLAGRAWTVQMFPFNSVELGAAFDLKKALRFGLLPDAYLTKSSDDSKEYLMSYVGTYLQKEIQQEQWVKKIEPFRKFLAVASQMNGQLINYSKIAKEVLVDDVTVKNYFDILEDTLIGFYLPIYSKSVRKSQRFTPKFYFIDPGIKRALDRTLSIDIAPQTTDWGNAFEHFIILEIKKMISYQRLEWEISFSKTKDDVEIDLIIDRPGLRNIQIEIKSKNRVLESDAKSLETLGKDLDTKAQRFQVSMDEVEHKFGSTEALHWKDALNKIFEDG